MNYSMASVIILRSLCARLPVVNVSAVINGQCQNS